MIELISFLEGRPGILMHFNRILSTCHSRGMTADCLTDIRSAADLKKRLLRGPSFLLYIIAHSSEDRGIEWNGKIFPAKDLASSFPMNKSLLPGILFLNTCYGKQLYLEQLQNLGIKKIIVTEGYIKLEDAMHYGEAFVRELNNKGAPEVIINQLNNSFTGRARYKVFGQDNDSNNQIIEVLV